MPSSSPRELCFCIASCCTGSKMWVQCSVIGVSRKMAKMGEIQRGLTPRGKDSFMGAEMKHHFR